MRCTRCVIEFYTYCSLTIWKDCGKSVAEKYYLDENDPKIAYCETDFFRRLNLLCCDCGGALRGSYISSLGKKYHHEHFRCQLCRYPFRANDFYYEHDGRIFCRYDYCFEYAYLCKGCDTPILEQYIDMSHIDKTHYWHLECFMIRRYWNVPAIKANVTYHRGPLGWKDENGLELSQLQIEAWMKMQESKVHQIWRILSAFEENTASQISQIWLHVSSCQTLHAIQGCAAFLPFVETLFLSLFAVTKASLGDNMKRTAVSFSLVFL